MDRKLNNSELQACPRNENMPIPTLISIYIEKRVQLGHQSSTPAYQQRSYSASIGPQTVASSQLASPG